MQVVSNQQVADEINAAIVASPAAYQAWQVLEANGGTVYVVGGALRDAYLGKVPKDVDLMVGGLTQEQIEAALRPYGAVNLTGNAFGVTRFRYNYDEVEIALPRVERSGDDANRKNFEVSTDPFLPPEEDLYRRDFTVNAMAYNLSTGQIVDPFGGAEDLSQGRLRIVNPNSFAEDATRLLRATTAYGRHGLYPDEYTLNAMRDEAYQITQAPWESIQMELDKILNSANPVGAIELAMQTGLMRYIMPELEATVGFDQKNPAHSLTLDQHIMRAFGHASNITSDPDVRLAVLLHDIAKPDSFWTDDQGVGHFYEHPDYPQSANHEKLGAEYVNAILRRLKFPNDRRMKISALVQHHMFPDFNTPSGARKFIQRVGGPDMARDLLIVREADDYGKGDGADYSRAARMRELVEQEIANQSAFTIKDLAVNGNDLISMGITAGPDMGRILRGLLDVVTSDPALNEKDTLLSLVQQQLV